MLSDIHGTWKRPPCQGPWLAGASTIGTKVHVVKVAFLRNAAACVSGSLSPVPRFLRVSNAIGVYGRRDPGAGVAMERNVFLLSLSCAAPG